MKESDPCISDNNNINIMIYNNYTNDYSNNNNILNVTYNDKISSAQIVQFVAIS